MIKIEFTKDLEHLINRHSVDNETNTPDFILAQYLVDCLTAYAIAVSVNKSWHTGSESE